MSERWRFPRKKVTAWTSFWKLCAPPCPRRWHRSKWSFPTRRAKFILTCTKKGYIESERTDSAGWRLSLRLPKSHCEIYRQFAIVDAD